MKLKDLYKKKEKLESELAKVQRELEKKQLLGFRVYCFGDEYNYGTYCDYFIKEYGKREALSRAKETLELHCGEGTIREIYPWNKKPPERIR